MNLRNALEISLIAAGYAALTVMVAPIAYGPIQARISDILLVLPFSKRFGKKAIIGLTVGALLSNLISPYGIYDIVLGTIANFFASSSVYLSRKIPVNWKYSLVIGIIGGIAFVDVIIGYVLLNLIYQVPATYAIAGVTLGEFLTFGVGGYILALGIEKRFGEEESKENETGNQELEGKT
ncbi:MAG: QueT transporter family protein [Fervidicoccaceae archaeon]